MHYSHLCSYIYFTKYKEVCFQNIHVAANTPYLYFKVIELD